MRALVLAGGRLLPTDRIRRLGGEAQLVLAADSGLRHAVTLGLEPEAVVGDFDSVSDDVLAAFPRIEELRHPVRKAKLDLEIAIDLAFERGARHVTVLGAFGSRLDQSLAALLIAARMRRLGATISLHDGHWEALPLLAGEAHEIDAPPGTLFSLLALEAARCSTSGCEYPLDKAELPFGVGLGLANRTLGRARVEVHEGLVVLMIERGDPE